jgi:Calcineurin-like phosphoesterase
MQVHYCSDLHLEIPENTAYLAPHYFGPAGEVLLLAGDIQYLDKRGFADPFFDYVSANYEQVFWVPGNHEFYGEADLSLAERPFDIPVRPNVRLVNNVTVSYKHVNFIFTTLWSRITLKNSYYIMRNLADFRLIRYQGQPLGTTVYNQFFQRSQKFLETAIDRNESEKMVVVTHHLPAEACNSPEFVGSALNEAFCVDLTDFIYASGVSYWIYGHSHRNVGPVTVNGTTLLTNQLGYVDWKEHRTFRPDAFFEI